jgi:hypothetical protein
MNLADDLLNCRRSQQATQTPVSLVAQFAGGLRRETYTQMSTSGVATSRILTGTDNSASGVYLADGVGLRINDHLIFSFAWLGQSFYQEYLRGLFNSCYS